MQLSEAIDGWLAAHSAGLSGSTRRDIADIAASADRCGYSWMDCIDVRERHLAEIVAEADAHSPLNASAIGQFLEIAVEWAITQTEARQVDNDLLPSDTDGWLDSQAAPVVDDLDLDEIAWVDDLPPVDDLDVDHDGELDPVDEAQMFDVDDIDAASDEDPETDEPDAVAAAEAEDLVDEDDFDDDELAAIDDDLTTTDEDELDSTELEHIDEDLDALLEDDLSSDEPEDDDLFASDEPEDDELFASDEPDEPAAEPAASAFATAAAGAAADPAASSFLRTLEQTGQTPAVFGDLASQPSDTARDALAQPAMAAPDNDVPSIDTTPGGIFSEAAQYDGSRSVDWITVAYFAVAAICFAFVIYLALSN